MSMNRMVGIGKLVWIVLKSQNSLYKTCKLKLKS
jgi:hypothetical protein